MSKLQLEENIASEELESLLKAREEGEIDFLLIDVREQMEYDMRHIKGVDFLKPTSIFEQWAEAFLNENQDKIIIFTCRTGSRSAQVQHIFKSNGMKNAVNHYGGIVTYHGDIER
ncbi:MAG: rhodanese-like domain-containing protein [Sulfurovum sp.]|nr:rhodanese-like domain-containing protein [Sulfurovum sp.]